jgi:putative heme-binding domain-containing protein
MLWAIRGAQADAYGLLVVRLRDSDNANVRRAADDAAKKLDLDALPNESDPNRITIATLKPEDVLADIPQEPGDAKLGSRLFVRQGCVACHSTKQGETLKGPYLGGVSAKYKRPELAESVLTPSKKIAQGFETQWFQTSEGLTLEGFVTRESGEEVELRNQQGAASIIAKSDIEERGKRETSMMPNGLIDKLTVKEFAALLAYLESLKQ